MCLVKVLRNTFEVIYVSGQEYKDTTVGNANFTCYTIEAFYKDFLSFLGGREGAKKGVWCAFMVVLHENISYIRNIISVLCSFVTIRSPPMDSEMG